LEVKEQINKKTFRNCGNVDTMENILKSWYRELPSPLLNVIKAEELSNIETVNQFEDRIESFPESNKSLFQWLINILTEIASQEKVNKMNAKNLAQSFAPSLYSTSNLEPVQQMNIASKIPNLINIFIDSKKK